MLILKIKQAEKAMTDGRLDEAYNLLQTPGLQSHNRGQELASRLSQALLARGRDHLDQGHLPQALGDCNKADRIQGQTPEVTALRQAVCQAMDRNYQAEQQQQQRLAHAQQQVKDGRLSVGEGLIRDKAKEDGRAALLCDEVEMQRLEIDQVLKELEEALNRDDLEQAITIVTSTGHMLVAGNGRCKPLLQSLKQKALKDIREDFAAGHVRRVQARLTRLQPLVLPGEPLDELCLAVTFCVEAAEAVEAGRLAVAERLLKKAQALVPNVTWLAKTLKQVHTAAEEIEAVHAGPLALLDRNVTVPPPVSRETVRTPLMTSSQPKPQKPVLDTIDTEPENTKSWILQVNGVGSYLVYTDSSLTVGPISSSDRPILGLLADPTLPTVTVSRMEEDYFLTSTQPVQVDRSPVRRSLLTDGQRISLSDRCRMKFNRPNAASTTATLTFTGGRLPRNDIRYALMMDDCILIGPSTNNHIRTSQTGDVVTLLHSHGQWTCQSEKPIQVAGQLVSAGTPLPIKETITIGEVSLVLEPA